MMKTFLFVSRNFKQAMISGGRVIMTTADESRALNSLCTKTVIIKFKRNAVCLRE